MSRNSRGHGELSPGKLGFFLFFQICLEMYVQCSVPHPIQSILTSVCRRLLPESIYSSAWVGTKEFMALESSSVNDPQGPGS